MLSPLLGRELRTSLPLASLLRGPLSTSHLLQIHAQIFRTGSSQDNLIATRLIGHYPPQFALQVFHHLVQPNIFPFNATIRVLSDNGLFSQAFSIFRTLKSQSLSPNDFTFSFLLKACFKLNDVRHVQQIHTHTVKSGFDRDSSVCTAILAVYAKGARDLVSARKVFDEMPYRGMTFCWTNLISGNAQMGRSNEALNLFLRMIEEDIVPEDDTMVSVLSACSSLEIGDIERWEKELVGFKNGQIDHRFEDGNWHIDILLIYLYGKLGKIEKSRDLFDGIVANGGRSLLHWNAMIGGYVQNALPVEAINLFKQMMGSQVSRPNHVTMVGVLSACAQVGNIELGRWVHSHIKTSGREGLLRSNTYLATAFIDMYSKCGCLDMAKEIFDQMVSKDVVSFNAMIMGLAINGEGERALTLFSKMEEFGVHPNGSTFLGVLCACNHSGMVGEGHRVFQNMFSRYSVIPELEHYACFIDLLSRVGLIEEAVEVVSSMPIEPNGLIWGAILGGCIAHSRLDIAQDVAKKLVEIEPENSAGYVMLSNAYANDKRWKDISELRGLMREKGVRKQPGCSWVSVDGVVHEFLVGCTSHPHIKKIYSTLDGLFEEMRLLDPYVFS